KVAREAYTRAERVLGEDHPSALALLDPIAGAASDIGDYETAEREHLHAVAINKRVMGPENGQTMIAMNNLAVVYTSRGKHAEAEAVLRELISIRQRTEKHITPSIISNRLNLAVAIS